MYYMPYDSYVEMYDEFVYTTGNKLILVIK